MNIVRIILSTALFVCLLFPIGWPVEAMSFAAISAPVAPANNCKCKSCQNKRKICRRCPKCQHDFCTLTCENKKVSKKCFDVDQKIVCIPKVTWPWQKCVKKCAKTRTVNVLKSKKYECCECKYTWSVCEPPLPKTLKQVQDEQELQMQPSLPQEAEKPGFESNELYDPAGSDVPQPPQAERPNG